MCVCVCMSVCALRFCLSIIMNNYNTNTVNRKTIMSYQSELRYTWTRYESKRY